MQRKYDVATGVALPHMTRLPKVVFVAAVQESELESVYYDTPDLVLADAGITLRRRTGGADTGWLLKLPLGGDDRSEIGEPLEEATAGVPAELSGRLTAWVRHQQLIPVATLSTRRQVHRLVGEAGKVLAEVCDDVVTAHANQRPGEAILSSWREWQIELNDGGRKLLAAVDQLFTKSGARRSMWPSKIHHALDRQPAGRPAVRSKLTDRSAAGAVLGAYLTEQVTVIMGLDSAARGSEPDAVHKMRVATRRLRSALSTFRPLVERAVTDPLRGELKWLATMLGGARDAEVQRMHLEQAVADEPGDLVLGPVAERIEAELQSDYRTAHDALLGALDSARYFQLLDSLNTLIAAPPFTDLATGKARPALLQRVQHACKTLYALVSLGEPEVGESRDPWLHEIRKAAKRVRYAAEAAEPTLGKSALALAAAAADLQETLGEHQDSVVTRVTLRAIGVRMHLDGENAFTIGRLHALQQSRAVASELAFSDMWSARMAEHLRGWIRR